MKFQLLLVDFHGASECWNSLSSLTVSNALLSGVGWSVYLGRASGIALDDLKLERIAVIYPGPQRYHLTNNVEVVPLTAAVKGMQGLFPENNGSG